MCLHDHETTQKKSKVQKANSSPVFMFPQQVKQCISPKTAPPSLSLFSINTLSLDLFL